MADICRRSLQLASIATMWLITACSADAHGGPSLLNAGDRGPAVLAFYGDTAAVELPAATRVGQPTTLRFTSFAGGCIRQDSTEANVAGLAAEVRPYRRDPRRLAPELVCTADLRMDNNVVELRFTKPGRARVRIVGLAQPGDHRFVIVRDLEVTP